MFADNGKISLRQIKRLLIFNIFGMASLLLPDILAGRSGVDGAVAILCGLFCTFLLPVSYTHLRAHETPALRV